PPEKTAVCVPELAASGASTAGEGMVTASLARAWPKNRPRPTSRKGTKMAIFMYAVQSFDGSFMAKLPTLNMSREPWKSDGRAGKPVPCVYLLFCDSTQLDDPDWILTLI